MRKKDGVIEEEEPIVLVSRRIYFAVSSSLFAAAAGNTPVTAAQAEKVSQQLMNTQQRFQVGENLDLLFHVFLTCSRPADGVFTSLPSVSRCGHEEKALLMPVASSVEIS
ncbi:hypothetical protein Q8A73_007412 [Channa argus]|nr:hypothetical protein Q8A73_007412 [Channa argus]